MRLMIAILTCSSVLAADGPTQELFVRMRNAQGHERLVPERELRPKSGELKVPVPAFVGVVSPQWPTGLVPIFATESESNFQLHRLPPRGQENFVEPFFFALPLADEVDATNIAGTWNCAATNAQGSKHYPDWELAITGERVAGRFSQHGEYRVAFITGGTFRSNRFELNAEYINDRYTLSGAFRGGKLFGTWRQLDNEENGTWEATRTASNAVALRATEAVPLFEWRRGGECRYSVETSLGEPGWTRTTRPLGLVWKSK